MYLVCYLGQILEHAGLSGDQKLDYISSQT